MKTPEAVKTRVAWNVFKRLPDKELEAMLMTAGIVPMKDRSMRLQQAITVWFHGDVPSMTEVVELANQPLKGEAFNLNADKTTLLGEAVARTCKMKVNRQGNYKTLQGDLSPYGIGRMIVESVEDTIERPADELRDDLAKNF